MPANPLFSRVHSTFYQHVLSTLKVVQKKIKPPSALYLSGLKTVFINTFCPISLIALKKLLSHIFVKQQFSNASFISDTGSYNSTGFSVSSASTAVSSSAPSSVRSRFSSRSMSSSKSSSASSSISVSSFTF